MAIPLYSTTVLRPDLINDAVPVPPALQQRPPTKPLQIPGITNIQTTGGNQPAEQMFTTMVTGGNQPPVQQTPTKPMQIAGIGLPISVPPTGGNQPPVPINPPSNPIPPINYVPQGPGNYSAVSTPSANSAASQIAQLAQQFGLQPRANAGDLVQQYLSRFAGPALDDPTAIANRHMDAILNSGNQYMVNAIRRGLSTANSRGLMNSNLAAGAAQAAAIDASMPIFQQTMGLTSQREAQDFNARQNAINQALGIENRREGEDFESQQNKINLSANLANAREGRSLQAEENAAQRNFQSREGWLDRSHQASMENLSARNRMEINRQEFEAQARQAQQDFEFRRRLQSDSAAQADWLANQQFSREFNARLSTLPIESSFDIINMMNQYAAEDPEVYTPQVVSGMTNFLTQNMFSILDQYFPSLVNRTGTQNTQPPGG